tara:strand:- start:44 stop:310 length:267 start_codon:yes stop_codon:yes gene_type:complete
MTYEDFLVMAHGSTGLEPKYNVYLEYVEVLEFVKAYANNNSDVFSYKNTIYNKKITIGEAQSILKRTEKKKFDKNIRICALQLGLKLR